MRLKSISGIMLTLLFVSVLTLAFGIQLISVEATNGNPIHNIDTGLDYATIQAAIDAPETMDGHIIKVDAGSYDECVYINKIISLIGEDPSTTKIWIDEFLFPGPALEIFGHACNLSGFTVEALGNQELGDAKAIHIRESSNVHITNCTVSGGYGYSAIWILDSTNVTIKNCEVEYAGPGYGTGPAIKLEDSHNNTVNSCKLYGVGGGWLQLVNSSDNVVLRNDIFSSGIITHVENAPSQAIDMVNASNNIFFENSVSQRGYEDWVAPLIKLSSCSSNLFYHNNMYTGTVSRFVCAGAPIVLNSNSIQWDAGHPCGGNYWNNYTDEDLHKGPYQNETGSDGLGDTPYVIDENNQDNYPLMVPWHQPPWVPVSSFVYFPLAPIVNETVTFNASTSYDFDGDIVGYAWDFGDGTTSTETAPITTHAYLAAETHNISLTVTDNDGLNNTTTKLITIGKLSSTISIMASPTTITIGQNTTINGTITPTREGATVTIWHKLLGDGIWENTTAVATDQDSYYSYDWMPSEAGTYELKSSWLGDGNTFGAESSTITVIRWARPIASYTHIPLIPLVGEEILINASSSYDLDEDIVSYFWDFDDGNTSSTANPTINHTFWLSALYNVTLTVIDSWSLNSSYSQTVLVRMPTSISISTSTPSTLIGFKVNITGTLLDMYGNSIEGETVVLYYTFSGITTWTPITSDTTDTLGNYHVMWIPPATGYFELKAEWAGNTTHLETNNTTTLSSLAYNNEYIFAVESNSTISELAFNTTDWTLRFTATGLNGTRGYVKVTIAKSLVTEITSIRVYLDGDQTEYSVTSMDDSWLLTFNYIHSTHQVAVDLDISIIPEFPLFIILPLFIVVTLLAVVVCRRKRSMSRMHTKCLDKRKFITPKTYFYRS